eukprot:CAMPEP_0198706178 /NCGR_PEP_ID=MMETSP1468-20131203/390831_1 /TAXON_ID=1461545 /ORGANISM="Mantoniella sp, Strain CCMP1436" /LENGTH=49 /DNA_ID=CAMNT_0044465107 /DNA_START=1865 /DNA_END=2014 /DNA_ORIENTATION=+
MAADGGIGGGRGISSRGGGALHGSSYVRCSHVEGGRIVLTIFVAVGEKW